MGLLHALALDLLIQKRYRLHAGYLKALTTAGILARHQIIPPDHIGASLGELGAVALISARRQLTTFGADEPAQIVFR